MLGSNLGIPVKKSFFGAADRGTQFWRSELQCTGSEENLEDCDGKEMPSCARGEVAGLICYFGGDLRKLGHLQFYQMLTQMTNSALQQQGQLVPSAA